MRNERGLTLVEVMISMAILMIVFFGLMESARIAVEFNVRNAVRDEGVRVTEQVMEQARNEPFANLNALAGPLPDGATATLAPVTRQIRLRNVTYAVQRNLTQLDANAIQLTVTTTYQRTDGQAVTVTATSLVRNRPL